MGSSKVVLALLLFGLAIGWLAAVRSPLLAEEAAASPPDLPRTGQEHPELAPLDRLMESFLRENRAPGAALAVTRGGKLVYARGFGYADCEARQPVQPDSLFRIASISKPITAVAVLQLVEQGKLNLDDAAYDHLSEDLRLPAEAPPQPLGNITVRHLLQHRGGWDRSSSFDAMFRAVEIAERFNSPPPAGPKEVIRFMHEVPLDFAPGTDYAYSNFGYCLLGRIVEAKSGQTYEQYVQENVLQPLGIRAMRIGRTLATGRHPDEVRYYHGVKGDGPKGDGTKGDRPSGDGVKEDSDPGGRVQMTGKSVFAESLGEDVPLPYGTWHLEAMDSHGGWIGSARDLVRFASALDDPGNSPLLSEESIAALYDRPTGPHAELAAMGNGASQESSGRVHYGLGWLVRTLPHSKGINVWHTGSLPGTSTILVRRHDGLNWAVLFNTREAANGAALAREIDPLIHRAIDQVHDWPE